MLTTGRSRTGDFGNSPVANVPARLVRDAVCEAMGSAVPEGFRPQAPTPATVAAGTDEPERVAVQGVAADTAVFDTDAATSYRDGVKHSSAPLAPSGWAEPASYGDTRHKTLKTELSHACDCLSRNLSAVVADPPHLQGHAMSCPTRLAESLRRARLSRWQEQRG